MLALALVAAGAGCTKKPYGQIRSAPVATATEVDLTVSGDGLRLALAARCQIRVMDMWCPLTKAQQAGCTTPPTIRKQEDVACPRELDFKGVQVSIRAPWGRVYSALPDANGIVQIPVDWTETEVDPQAAGAAEQLANGWLVSSDEARAIPLKIEPDDVQQMLSAIAAAGGEVGAANEKATLTAELGEALPLVLGSSGAISLAIKNSGPQPAYRVVAKLRSSVDALHGHQLVFGRIDPGQTKVKTREVAIPPKLDERSALVVAEISYYNGERFDTKRKFEIVPETKRAESPEGLAADCKLATAEVAPGERVRIHCELRNLGKAPVNDLTVAVSVGSVGSKNVAPKTLPPAGSEKIELIGLTSPSEKQGTEVPVVIRVGAPGVSPIDRTLSVRIASFATRCQKRLTRDEYKAKRKRLQAALDAGTLSQKEFDKYDADLLGCLE